MKPSAIQNVEITEYVATVTLGNGRRTCLVMLQNNTKTILAILSVIVPPKLLYWALFFLAMSTGNHTLHSCPVRTQVIVTNVL